VTFKPQLVVHADATAAEAATAAELQQGVGGLELRGRQAPVASKWLMENLDSFRAFAGRKGEGVHLAEMPPPFQRVPANPIVLDTVRCCLARYEYEAHVGRFDVVQSTEGASQNPEPHQTVCSGRQTDLAEWKPSMRDTSVLTSG
jgi:hypothetical protein